jgi:hypothetical protein
MDERFDLIRTTLENYIRELHDRAAETAVRFELFTVDGNSIRDGWKEQNTLKYRVRREKNTLSLEWYQRVWIRDGSGKPSTMHHYIRKRNKNKRGTDLVYSYHMADLYKFSPDWSKERVMEVEVEAASFRRQAHYCSQMLIMLGRLERYVVQLEGVVSPTEEAA